MSSSGTSGSSPVTAPQGDVSETSGGDSRLEQDVDLSRQKKSLRKRMKAALKAMSDTTVDAASAAVAERLLACPELQRENCDGGREGAVSVYLSMPGELGTADIVNELFKRGKKVYIPKVLGAASADMRMFPLQSAEEVASFPLTKWKIREPSEELALSRKDGVAEGDIGVVIVPAVAFDSRCNRLGHGRGHYDCFFERVDKANKAKGRPPPVKMGVCFDEQVVDCVPTEDTDVRLDFVLTPTRTF
ncbi:unnamed protein product, partial [Hapterophycus canaliculatus]